MPADMPEAIEASLNYFAATVRHRCLSRSELKAFRALRKCMGLDNPPLKTYRARAFKEDVLFNIKTRAGREINPWHLLQLYCSGTKSFASIARAYNCPKYAVKQALTPYRRYFAMSQHRSWEYVRERIELEREVSKTIKRLRKEWDSKPLASGEPIGMDGKMDKRGD